MSKIIERIGDEVYEQCQYCNGTGKVKHQCNFNNHYTMKTVKTYWSHEGYLWSESLVIKQCTICGKLYMVRFQFDDGCGYDDIWLEVGESKRGYTFTEEEAMKVLEELQGTPK
jgi:hypothetical protein